MGKALVVALFGLLPSLAFFWWLAHGCRPPALDGVLPVYAAEAPYRPLWNLTLFLMFGLWHSGTAGSTDRVLYTVLAGVTALGVVAFWQPAEGALWVVGSPELHWWFSSVQFLVWLLLHGWIVSEVGLSKFLGVTDGPDRLVTTGPFKLCRHPMHLNILAMLLVTPAMTADRLTLLLAITLYLAFAVPTEEDRMRERFGKEWLEYRSRTPALVPRLL